MKSEANCDRQNIVLSFMEIKKKLDSRYTILINNKFDIEKLDTINIDYN